MALDIGTEFVKAVILKIEKSFFEEEGQERGLVIGFSRQRQFPGHMLAGAVADIDGVALTCRRAIDEASQMARIKPSQVVLGIAGEFIKGITTNFAYQRNNPEEEISLVELQNIIQKIQWRSFDRTRSQLACETCRPEVEIKPINALLTEIKVDGYSVTNPLGFQGKEIFLSIFNIYAPLVHLRALEKIADKLNLDLLSIAAEPYALTKSSSFNPTAGAIFVDIGGGTTDIALVRQGRVEGIKSLSLAGQAFTKRLSQRLNLGLAEAEEIKIRHSQKRLSQSVHWKIREILKKDIDTWLDGVELVLEDFERGEFFPPLILLCGGGSILPEIKNILKKENIQKRWLNKFPFSRTPQVNFIRSKQIDNIIDQSGLLTGPESITPLALSNLSLEIVTGNESPLSSVLRRTVRIMR